jgi:hypothetical protein
MNVSIKQVQETAHKAMRDSYLAWAKSTFEGKAIRGYLGWHWSRHESGERTIVVDKVELSCGNLELLFTEKETGIVYHAYDNVEVL